MPVNSLQIKAQFRLLGQLGLESCSLASVSRTSWQEGRLIFKFKNKPPVHFFREGLTKDPVAWRNGRRRSAAFLNC